MSKMFQELYCVYVLLLCFCVLLYYISDLPKWWPLCNNMFFVFEELSFLIHTLASPCLCYFVELSGEINGSLSLCWKAVPLFQPYLSAN